jgi:PHD/YefM family antitoxin component YafN of YafNO toxin-antitoxin module
MIEHLKHFSTADLARKVGDVTHAAAEAPVVITQHKKPRFVLLTAEYYEFMRSKDPRRVYRTDETPEEVREWLLPALEAYLASKSDDAEDDAA